MYDAIKYQSIQMSLRPEEYRLISMLMHKCDNLIIVLMSV